MAIIEFEGVSLQFDGGDGVNDITFTLEEGTIMVLVGPSGCGKSTILRLLLGLHEPQDGTIHVMGTSPAAFTLADRKRLAYVPQSFVLYPMLTVEENTRFAASIYGVGLRERRARLRQALDVVELSDVRGRQASDLSGGMQRRLQLAAALMNDADIIVADEPTAGVDPMLRSRLWEHLKQLRDQGKTIVAATQYIEEVQHGDVTGVMRDGRLLYAGSPAEIRSEAFGGEFIDVYASPGEAEKLLELFTKKDDVLSAVRPPGVPGLARLQVRSDGDPKEFVRRVCAEADVDVESIRTYTPSFEEVFRRMVTHHD